MAYCSQCQQYISHKEIMTKALICEGCNSELRFNVTEYKNITRPGFYIALFLLINIYIKSNPAMSVLINITLVVLWFFFFKRFLKYIHEAQLEIKGA